MRLLNVLRAFGLALCVLATAVASPASAEWRRAESQRFIVYSTGGEAPLLRYVQSLEMYDYILRYRMGLPLDGVAARKLSQRGQGKIWLGGCSCGCIDR